MIDFTAPIPHTAAAHGFLSSNFLSVVVGMAPADPQNLADSEQLERAAGYFAAADERFISALREVHDIKLLAQFADHWKRDSRPWAHQQQLDYLRLPANCVGHQTVVKQLFKQAEETADHPVLAVCAALFDRLVRHQRRTRYQYDWSTRSSWQEEYLRATGAKLLTSIPPRVAVNPFTQQEIRLPPYRPAKDAVYFSYRTRYYLQRRAWRYFRRLGASYFEPGGSIAFRPGFERYLKATALVLMEYQDADFVSGERILDSWTLLQLAFRHHPALEFGRERVRLAEGGRLDQLRAAPRFLELWITPHAFDFLVKLLRSAPSRLVRVWAMQLIEAEHGRRVAELSAKTLLELLASEDNDIQEFAARLLKDCRELGALPLETWRRLLGEAGPHSLPAICAAAEQHVSGDRWSLTECVDLALREPTPLAQLGFNWLRTKSPSSEADYAQLARLAGTKCAALAGEMAEWALTHVGSKVEYDRDGVSHFFDSLSLPVREAAWRWLEKPTCPGADDPVLFCRLLETPFDDLKLRVVDLLERRNLPGEARTGLLGVWSAVLLGVHRGGRQKLKATKQLAEALVKSPQEADNLMPILAAAVRSSRRPEARAALAAVVGALAGCPELHEPLAIYLPELSLQSVEALA